MDHRHGAEPFAGFSPRPFSLTPDPRFYFRSRSHGRVFDTLSAAIDRRESLMLVAGDLGVGKTTLSRTLIDARERQLRAVLIANALLSPEDLLRVMLQDLGAVTAGEVRDRVLAGCTRHELVDRFDRYLRSLHASGDRAVVIVDEAHSLPPATMEQVVEVALLESNRHRALQFLLAGQPAIGAVTTLPKTVDERLAVRARLLPLERDECERYVHHRLAIAGGGGIGFSPSAIDAIYTLSGGLPRLVNLLGERALQEAAVAGSMRIEPRMIESAAAVLDLVRLRPKRFRWYGAAAR